MTSTEDLRSVAQYATPILNNLGIKVDTDLTFGSQIEAVVKTSVFQLRRLVKIKKPP